MVVNDTIRSTIWPDILVYDMIFDILRWPGWFFFSKVPSFGPNSKLPYKLFNAKPKVK